jgi:hypothetical protein
LQDNLETTNSNNELQTRNESQEENLVIYSYDDYTDIEELHWGKMPIKYHIMNPEVCGPKVIEQINDAFETIQNETDNIVKFEQTEEDVGISIECFHRYGENIPITTKASSKYAYAKITHVFDDDKKNVISRAEIKLFKLTPGKYYGRCGKEPVIIIHEILHLFNFDDSGKSRSIMYRYVGSCDLEIDEDIIEKLKETYSKKSE